MKQYNTNFLRCFEEIEVERSPSTKKETDDTFRNVMKRAGLKRKTTGMKKGGRIFLIAAAIAACGVVTVAAYAFSTGDLFRSFFESNNHNGINGENPTVSLTESQVKVLDKSGTALNQSVTNNGTTITVKAAVCDQSNAYILLDIIAPEGTKLNRDDYDFEHTYTVLDLNDVHNSFSREQKLSVLKDENPNDNKKSFVVHMGCSGFDMRNRKLQLTLGNLSTVREGKAVEFFNNVIEGTWRFDPITLKSSISSKELTVNKVTHFKESVNPGASAKVRTEATKITYQCTVKSISLSSFSATVNFSGEEVKTKGDSLRVPDVLTIRLKDGTDTVINYPSGGGSEGKDSDNVWRFDTPIDFNNVTSVTLGDLTIPIS
nr:DUF4179 domain-containing protein [uncultured Caproiciproducens sp.]